MANNVLVLHPRHKLAYFEKQMWEDSWIEDAWKIVHHEFERSYAPAIRSQKDNTEAPKSSIVSTRPLSDPVIDPF